MRAILLLICCRSSKWLGVASMNGWSPPRPLGVRPTTIQILPGCLVVVGDTAEEARQKRALVSKCGRERVIERARRDNLTVRQLAQIAGSYGGLALVYSAACDGFDIMFRWVPGGLDGFVDRVVPELQRGNLFRREYEGRTLRENLGLPRPETASSASQKASRDACFRSPFLRARVRAVPRCALLCCARNGPDFPSLGSRPRCAGASCGID
jgi:hypothetical protein